MDAAMPRSTRQTKGSGSQKVDFVDAEDKMNKMKTERRKSREKSG